MASRNVIGALHSARALHSSCRAARGSIEGVGRIGDLLAQFKDPNSPFHIAPGETGPSSEDDHSTSKPLPTHQPTHTKSSSAGSSKGKGLSHDQLEAKGQPKSSLYQSADSQGRSRKKALEWFKKEGFDERGMLEWPIAWGDHDQFQHVNSVRMMRFFESARIRYAETWTEELGLQRVQDMLQGKGIGVILRDISIRYRLPVTYPDNLLIACRPHSINQERASFGMAHAAWSLKSRAVVATGDSTIVMYDYDRLCKGTLSDELRDLLENRAASPATSV